jgi:hypothetical protein
VTVKLLSFSYIMFFVPGRKAARAPSEGKVIVCEDGSRGLLITP